MEGEAGIAANRRSKSLIDLFFAVTKEMSVLTTIEVGAHGAEASRRFVADDPHARAVAFEASPTVYRNVLAGYASPRLETRNTALGPSRGRTTFYAPRNPGLAVWGSTLRRAGFDDVEEIQVPMTTLDREIPKILSRSRHRKAALWCDVEGFIYDVLTGAKRSLRSHVKSLYIEVNDQNTYDKSATAVKTITLLLDCGFVPIARDNEYHDAWNLVAMDASYFEESNQAFADWSYAEKVARDQANLT